MRNFLPIKGPGGRNLTGKEKIALMVLVVTLLLCVLTLVAGEKAYLLDEAPNPIFSIVAAFGSALGGGIVALYALIMVWSALIYLKGERVADITPIVGRCAAAFAVTIGISGALGIAHLEAAGGLGDLVGRSLGNTFGAGAGFPILILLMLLGAHLASQGAWTALREPMMPALATAGGTLAPVGYGFGLAEAPESRLQDGPPMPDDGDPTADERSLAVQQAVEEIERSQGVTIVDVEPADEAEEAEYDENAEAEAVGNETRSIGEEVHEAPEPDADTEEAEVQRGLAAVTHALQVTHSAADDDAEVDEEEQTEEEARYASERHGLVPVPVGEQPVETSEDESEEEDEEEEDEFAEVEQYDDEDEDYETAEADDEEEEEDDEEYEDEGEYAQDDEELDDEEEEFEEEDEDADEGEYAEYDDEEADEEEDDVEEGEEEGEYASDEDADADEEEEEDDEHEQLELFADERGEAELDIEEDVDDEELEDEVEEDEPALEATPPEPEPDPAPAAEPAEADTDPYAQGGLLRRLQARGPQSHPGGDRPHTAFDWRGRPIK